MESITKHFELQIDEKPSGVTIRLNNDKCVLRISGVPKELVYEPDGSVKEFIDIAYPKENKKSAENVLTDIREFLP